MTSIVKYKKDNKEKGPFRDYEAVLKELKKERDTFVRLRRKPQGAWEKIVEQKVGVSDWTDLRGRKHQKKRGKTYKHFLECTMFHLQTVFDEDDVERQQIYISNHLKKPQRVMVRAFFTRVEQLNSYVKYLPSIYNSPKATESPSLLSHTLKRSSQYNFLVCALCTGRISMI